MVIPTYVEAAPESAVESEKPALNELLWLRNGANAAAAVVLDAPEVTINPVNPSVPS